MLKKVLALVAVVTVVAALGLYAVGTVFAQDPTPAPDAGPPPGGAWGRMCRGAGVIGDAVAELLGMSREEIQTERSAGKTLSEIAQEKGITDQQVIDAMLAGQKEGIDQALADGRITQAQADWLLARAEAMAPFELSNPFSPRGDDHGDGPRGMRGGHGCWEGKAPAPTEAPSE